MNVWCFIKYTSSAPVLMNATSFQVPKCQCPQLYHQLERWSSVQCHSAQTQVSIWAHKHTHWHTCTRPLFSNTWQALVWLWFPHSSMCSRTLRPFILQHVSHTYREACRGFNHQRHSGILTLFSKSAYKYRSWKNHSKFASSETCKLCKSICLYFLDNIIDLLKTFLFLCS